MMVSLLSTVPCFKAIQQLIDAGVDGIILSDKDHATIAAENVTLTEIQAARAITRAQNIRLDIRCDRNFYDEELAELKQYLLALKNIGVDGVYYADMAVWMLADELAMSDRMIYDPETTLTNQPDIAFYCRQNQRVVLAKELTLAEMLSIGQANPDQTEMIVHGYLRMSRSRRQILSGYQRAFQTEDLHSKRNITAQEESRDVRFPIAEDDFGTYTYSHYLLCALPEIARIKEHIAYLRIEALFQDLDYLLAVIKAYRQVLDGQKAQPVQEALGAAYPQRQTHSGFMYEKTNL